MQLTAEQIAKLSTENGESYATLAHLSDQGASLVFGDNSMESVLVGDTAISETIGTRIYFGTDGKVTRSTAPTYKAPAPKQGQGSTALRPNL